MDLQTVDSGSLSGYSPFVDVATLYVRDFGGGERELQIRKGWIQRTPSGQLPARSGGAGRSSGGVDDPGPWDEAFDAEAFAEWREARRARDDLDAENRDRSVRRARQIACQRIKAIKADRLLTLTYRENVKDRDRVVKDWQRFVRRVRKVQGFEYVAVLERQKRGAYHVHVAIRGRQNYRVLRSVWLSIVGPGMGNIDVRNPWRERALRHKLAAYLSKYVGKGFEGEAPGARRVWCSEGIAVPERTLLTVAWSSWPEIVAEAVQLLPDGAEFSGWFSGRRDLFFLTTSERC